MISLRSLPALLAAFLCCAAPACDSIRLRAADTSESAPAHGSGTRAQEGHESAPIRGAGLGDLRKSKVNDTVLGWDVQDVGDKIRWKHCGSSTECSTDTHERSKLDVISTRPAGRARPRDAEGEEVPEGEVDVMEIKMLAEPR